jgi:hypothetical protein
MGEKRSVYGFGGETGRDYLEDLNLGGRIILKWNVNRLGRHGFDLSGSGYDISEYGNDALAFIKCGEFHNQLRNH